MRRSSAFAAPTRPSRSRPTATDATRTSIRAKARASRWRKRRATSPAPAAVRWRSRTILNFGNPKRPEVYFQLREAVAGMGEACIALGTPVTGGNVSLYNENPPAPCIPRRSSAWWDSSNRSRTSRAPRSRRDGDAIVLLGDNTDEIGGSEYLQRIHNVVAGAPPRCDLAAERALIDALLDAIARRAARRTTAPTAAWPSRWPSAS